MADLNDTLFVLRAADYIRDQLVNIPALTPIQLFLRGTMPPGSIPQQLTPYCEVLLWLDEPNPAMHALGETGHRYTGMLRFVLKMTQLTGRDWVEMGGKRSQNVESYTVVAGYISAARTGLDTCAHRDLGGLVVANEAVCMFSLGRITYGLAVDQRQNSWSNWGAIEFHIRTAVHAA